MRVTIDDLTDDQLRNVARDVAGRDLTDEEADQVLLDLIPED